MTDSGFGSNAKEETVYSGPSPVGTTGTVYGAPVAPPPAGGTVYSGPTAGGTVYNGPSNGAPAGPASRQPLGSNGAVNVGARRGAITFYILAGFTAFRTLLLFLGYQQLTFGASRMVQDNLQAILVINLVIIAVLALLGIFTQKGSKTALVIGMVLYSADTLLLLFNPGGNIVFIVVHGFFLYRLFAAYGQFAE